MKKWINKHKYLVSIVGVVVFPFVLLPLLVISPVALMYMAILDEIERDTADKKTNAKP